MSPRTTLLANLAIDKHSYIPIYIQLKDIIKGFINEEKVKPGQLIPSENELSAAFGISRITVRQSIAELAREGYVYVKRGQGTFVSSGPGSQMLFKLDGFSAEMTKQGYTSRSKTIAALEVSFAEKYAAAYTGLRERPESTLVVITRVRFLENSPFALETSYLKLENGRTLLVKVQDENLSIYRHLEKEQNVTLARAEHTIEPRMAQKDAAALLCIKQGSPVLSVKGTTYSDRNMPIEYLEGIYRGDKYKLKVEIRK